SPRIRGCHDSSAADAHCRRVGSSNRCCRRALSCCVRDADQAGGGSALRMMLSTKSAEASFVVQATEIWKSYEQGAIAVLNGVNLEARKSEAIALCGP